MCGIFGMVRSAHDPDPALASSVFVALGHLAEQRGRDAAGFLLVGDDRAFADDDPGGGGDQPRDPVDSRDTRLGRCRVVKDTRRWGLLWRPDFVRALDAAEAAIGHTRHASQGSPGVLANAAPLVVGDGLIGVHNGDVDVEAFRGDLPMALPAARGETDSEVLLLALDQVRGDLPGTCDVLETARGVATLAWVDRHSSGLVHLARAALCPLAIATDAHDNLYWASAPSWFRRLDEQAGGRIGFQVERVREGTVLVIAAGGTPSIRASRSFEPVARPGDGWRFPSIWNGLDSADVEAFQAEASHRTARPQAARRAELAPAGSPRVSPPRRGRPLAPAAAGG
jgi:glutamine phosphoribosylpyrophosphate amidotransferase